MMKAMGLSLVWLCVLASHAMAVTDAPVGRIWVTTGNGHDTGIVDEVSFTSSTSIYLWTDLPYVEKGPEQQITLTFFLSGDLGNDYQVSVNESSAALAIGERMIADSFKDNNHEYSVNGVDRTISSVFETNNGVDASPDWTVGGNNDIEGIYCLGKLTFSDLQPSVNQIQVSMGAFYHVFGGDYNRIISSGDPNDTGYFADYNGNRLTPGNQDTYAPGTTFITLKHQTAPVVPEPGSYVILAGMGLVGTAWYRCRRRAK